jgi:hypothetical protein
MVMSVIACWLRYLVSLAYPAGRDKAGGKATRTMEQ